jgi:parallel beta-helix repeat protein
MKKECLAVVIVFLFLGTSLIPSALSEQTHGKTIITVDDELGDADYTSIKEALNHSNPGDTIEVFSGTYYEHGINITNERISLIGIPHELGNGSDTGKPFINGQGFDDVINVNARNVTITDFHVENNGEGAYSIIGIGWGADGCVLSDNYLSNSVMSIVGCASNYSTIINNTISYSGIRDGVILGPYGHNVVSGNTIHDVDIGIDLWDSYNNLITGNKISKCYSIGIDIAGHYFNTVSYNTLEGNPIGLHLLLTKRNRIEMNNFINNTKNAYFEQGLELPGLNRWIQNYWGQSRLLPYPIFGTVFIFPWVQFDWRPAQKPYNITRMT